MIKEGFTCCILIQIVRVCFSPPCMTSSDAVLGNLSVFFYPCISVIDAVLTENISKIISMKGCEVFPEKIHL